MNNKSPASRVGAIVHFALKHIPLINQSTELILSYYRSDKTMYLTFMLVLI